MKAVLGSLRKAALLLLVGAISVGAASAASARPTSVQPDVVAKKCKSGFRHAVVAGAHRCLKAGQKSARRFDRQYHRAGFHCHGKRLTRSTRRTSPPPPQPTSPPRIVVGPLPAGVYETQVFEPALRFRLGAGWSGVAPDTRVSIELARGNALLGFTSELNPRTVAQAVALLTSVPGLSSGPPTAATIAGVAAQRIEATVTSTTRVDIREMNWVLPPDFRVRFYVLEVRGRTLVIVIEAPTAEFAAFAAEAEAVLATLSFP